MRETSEAVGNCVQNSTWEQSAQETLQESRSHQHIMEFILETGSDPQEEQRHTSHGQVSDPLRLSRQSYRRSPLHGCCEWAADAEWTQCSVGSSLPLNFFFFGLRMALLSAQLPLDLSVFGLLLFFFSCTLIRSEG